MRKCKFINKITINSCNECEDLVIQMVTKYCNHLKSIKCDFNHICDKSLIEFGLKFGPKLQKIEFSVPVLNKEKINSIQVFLRLCPNLLTLNNANVESFEWLDTFLPKLTAVENLFLSEDIFTEYFVEKYENLLKSFKSRMPLNYVNESEVKQNFLLRQISKLKSLEELQVIFNCFDTTIVKIKLIADKCKDITKLDLDVSLKYTTGDQLMESIGHFKNLKHLTIRGIEEEMSIKSLKNCKQLKVLKLGNKYITDQFFTDIETIVPQLTHLVFGSYGQDLITDKTFHCLAKLKKLEILYIDNRRHWQTLTDEGLCDLIDNCPQLKSINFRRKPNITEKTVNALIALALRKPRICFKHYLGINYRYFAHYNDSNASKEEIIIDLCEKLPNNLSIELY